MKHIILCTLAFLPFVTFAQNDSIAAEIKKYQTALSEVVWKYGEPYLAIKEKKILYKSYNLFSTNRCLVMYEEKKAKNLYLLAPNGYFYFDLGMDGVLDGKYSDRSRLRDSDIWENVIFISNLPKHVLDSTVSANVDLSKIESDQRFQLYDLRNDTSVIYNTLRLEGTPEIIPVPNDAVEFKKEIEGIRKTFLKLLEFEEFGKN